MIESFPETADREARMKRARMRAWRRGMREMDLILGGYIDRHGATLDGPKLDHFEALLSRRDQDLYAWISGRDKSFKDHATEGELNLLAEISETWRKDSDN
jgi:antitoxin CptB